MSKTRVTVGLGASVVVMTLAGCSGSSSKGSVAATSTFNDQHSRHVTCMVHQTAAPVALDHPGPAEDPASVLAYLRYYTSNGDKPYCDGMSASPTDRQWLTLYIDGGSSRSNVARALSGK